MFRKTLMARALAGAFCAPALLVTFSTTAVAQTSASGSVFGQVASPAGSSIVIESLDTGARRTIAPGVDGKYQVNALPVGRYRVTLQRNGAAVSTRDDVVVVIGGGADVSFGDAQTLQTVSVVGRRQTIDVSNVGSTTTFTSAELTRLPVTPNVASIIQLAPGTTRGDSRYGGGNAPSYGGASASENATYINGFPVTTLLTQVGFAQLPFNAISQAQILTGGYGVEFGRSTGGVANIVTKSGSNELVFGVGTYIEPSGLRSKAKNQYYGVNGNAAVDGKLYLYNEGNRQEVTNESFYFGGPLVKDKLFFFIAGENYDRTENRIRSVNTGTQTLSAATARTNCGTGAGTFANASSCSSWQTVNVNEPKVLLKLDWNITDSHHLEYTKIYDEVTDNRTYSGFNYNTLGRNNISAGGANYTNWGPTPVASQQGASVDILKYTGYLTDALTFQAVLGETRTPHTNAPSGFNPALPQITATSPFPGLSVATPQFATGSLLVPGASDKNRGLRLDLDWRINSQHTVRFGLDYNKIQSVAGSATAGGSLWTYNRVTDPAAALDPATDTRLNTLTGNPIAQAGYYATQSVVTTNTTPTVVQAAEYIEDRWQVTDRFLLSLGLRNESFDNRNEKNESYIKITKQIAPRVGAAWDVNGDASLKVFANAGRYHVPIPTNVAVRAAGPSTNTTQNYAYTGVDPVTGVPTGLTALGAPYSPNNEYGQAKDPKTVAAQNMKGMYQDELSFGMEQAVSKSLIVGAKFTYRTLRTVIDDFCDDRPFVAWAQRNIPNYDARKYPGFNCALFNPGIDNTFQQDVDGSGQLRTIHLTKEELGYPKVSRKYMALDLTAEYPFDGKYWGKMLYTLSRSKGNTEGQLLSDIGQADVATTQAFDFPEFSIGANGPLPNDRKHQLKAFGYYQVLPEWGVGGNLLVASGRPKNCIGNPPFANYAGYTSAYFYCNGVETPRGSQGRLPPDVRFDMNVSYRPAMAPGLMLKLDVFNLFNRQTIETVSERYNQTAAATSPVANAYGTVLSYSTPRYVRLSATYDYKF